MSLKRGIVSTFFVQAPTLMMYFVASTCMTRILGDAGRGEYALFQNQVTLLAMLFGLSLPLGITYFTTKNNGDASTVVRIAATGFLFSLAGVLLMLLLIFHNSTISELFFPNVTLRWEYMAYLLLCILATQVNSWVSAILLSLKKFRTLNQLGVLAAALNAVGFSLLYIVRGRFEQDQGLMFVLGVSLASILIMTLVWCSVYVRVIGIVPVPTGDWTVIRPFLAFVLVSFISDLINLINYRFDIWVVGNSAGTAQLGLYAVAVGLGQLFFYIPEPFSRVVQPYLYGDSSPAMVERYKFIARLNFTTVGFLSLLLAVVAVWAIPLLYGDEFLGATSALYWLLPGIVFVSSSKLVTPLLVGRGLIRFYLYATTTAAVVTIILDLLLVPRWGIVGAALASTVSYLFLLVLQCAAVRYKMGIRVSDMFFLKASDLRHIMDLLRVRISTIRPN